MPRSQIIKTPIWLITLAIVGFLNFIIAELFLAYAIFNLLYNNFDYSTQVAAAITAIIFLAQSGFIMAYIINSLNNLTPAKIIQQEYSWLKNLLNAFTAGYKNK